MIPPFSIFSSCETRITSTPPTSPSQAPAPSTPLLIISTLDQWGTFCSMIRWSATVVGPPA
jgi:hypothetical protein